MCRLWQNCKRRENKTMKSLKKSTVKTKNKFNLKKYSVYEIFWIDAFSYGGWYDLNEIKEKTKLGSVVKSVGCFIGKIGDFVVICMNLNTDVDFKSYGNVKWIPIGVIKKIKKLK